MGNTMGYLKKNLNAPRLSEHSPVRGKHIKTFRRGHRLQRQKPHSRIWTHLKSPEQTCRPSEQYVEPVKRHQFAWLIGRRNPVRARDGSRSA